MASISLQNITKIFPPGITAVDNASLDVADGEFMVILGPSGCGKTTMLRLISGLEHPETGIIRIDDAIVNDLSPKDRDLAMVFQNHPLYPHMTIHDNIAFSLTARKLNRSEIETRVAQAANTLQITPFLNQKPHSLSGGQAQRVALARAIVRKPKAFLFDEPLSNLDPTLRLTARTELKTLHQNLQTTSIYVTHDQAEAMTLGDRICAIDKGKIQQADTPLAVYEKPANRFVAGFLGTTPMNFFDGRVEFTDEKPRFVTDDLSVTLPDRMKGALANHKNEEMILGIRPEHLHLEPLAGHTQNRIDCTVTLVEPLGATKDIFLQTKTGQTFTTTAPSHTDIKPSRNVDIYIDSDKAHIFEPGDAGINVSVDSKQ